MALIFDIGISAEFWRRKYPLDRAPENPAPMPPDVLECSMTAILERAPSWAHEFAAERGQPIDLLVLENAARQKSLVHKAYAWTCVVPEGSFYALKPDLLVESPEFMFLRAAKLLSLEQLIAFGDELCGLYSFDEHQERGFRQRKAPLTTKERLGRFLDKAAGCAGIKAAQRALAYVVERSASPMETFDVMTMCLPYKLGGYCIPQLAMNAKVPLTSRAARIARRKNCYLDMGDVDKHVDIEHHGRLDHSSDGDKESDRDRVNGLKEMGFEVIELTSNEVGDLFVYECIIERIACLLGKKISKEKLGALPARLKLRKELMLWNRSSGKIR